jgi:carbamoyltransferase
MKDRINRLVKHREQFRPFAPAILEERVSEYFEIEDTDPFMTLARKVVRQASRDPGWRAS